MIADIKIIFIIMIVELWYYWCIYRIIHGTGIKQGVLGPQDRHFFMANVKAQEVRIICTNSAKNNYLKSDRYNHVTNTIQPPRAPSNYQSI